MMPDKHDKNLMELMQERLQLTLRAYLLQHAYEGNLSLRKQLGDANTEALHACDAAITNHLPSTDAMSQRQVMRPLLQEKFDIMRDTITLYDIAHAAQNFAGEQDDALSFRRYRYSKVLEELQEKQPSILQQGTPDNVVDGRMLRGDNVIALDSRRQGKS